LAASSQVSGQNAGLMARARRSLRPVLRPKCRRRYAWN
jgi:hypothetical protein